MRAVEKPANKVDEAFKITKDMVVEEIKSDGKSTWCIKICKLCPKTHVPISVDHQVIQEPLAPEG